MAETILAQACENESQNANRMRMGLEPLPAHSVTHSLLFVKQLIGVGDGGRVGDGAHAKKSGKIFLGNYYVKFGHFPHFSGIYHVNYNSEILLIFRANVIKIRAIDTFFLGGGQISRKMRTFC